MACVPLNTPVVGAAVTVIDLVATASEHPPVPVTVYVIVALPAPAVVIFPPAVIVAIKLLLDVHVPPALVELKIDVPGKQTACVPLNTPVVGAAVTVTERVAVTSEQPPVPVTVYVISTVPTPTAVTFPPPVMVAIKLFADVQEPPATVELNTDVPGKQIACVPLNTPVVGAAVTVIDLVATASEHPPVPVTVYVMVAVPAPAVVIFPPAVMVAIKLLFDVQEPPALVELYTEVPGKQTI